MLTGPRRTVSPFRVLKTHGPYQTGKDGWHALPLKTPGGRSLVVFTTTTTSEDPADLVFEPTGAGLAYLPEDTTEGVTIESHDFNLRFDLPKKTAIVRDRVRFRRVGDMNEFLFRIGPPYRIQSIRDSAERFVTFAQTGGTVAVRAPAGSEGFTYSISYSAVVNLPQFAGGITDTEASLTNDYWYPLIARRPAPYRLTVHHPRGWTAVGQGEQVSTEDLGNERVTRFQMDLPCVYYSVSIGAYRTVERQAGARRLWARSLHKSDAELRIQTELYEPILDFYDRTFGKFPFSAYGALESDVYGAGALEAYSYATYGGELPQEDAHEPSHTWWGGTLNNSYLHSLWNESFANFSVGLYQREVPIGNQAERRLAFIKSPEYDPLWEETSCQDSGVEWGPAASALGYGKGAFVLQMLERELGTPMMIETLREWVKSAPPDRTVDWQYYEAIVTKVAGPGHKTFFDQWLRRAGVAEFEVTDVSWSDGRLSGRVNFKSAPYRIPCEIMLVAADGRRAFTQFDTMQIGGMDGYRFNIECEFKPTLVSVDPWLRIVRQIHEDEHPIQLARSAKGQVLRDVAHPDWRPELEKSKPIASLPGDLSGLTIVGSPETLPGFGALCGKAGFVVKGNELTYDGTTIDLQTGTATAVVDLGGGKHCVIALGKCRHAPNFGHSRLCLTDDLGRFLRGVTEPKTSGFLTVRL